MEWSNKPKWKNDCGHQKKAFVASFDVGGNVGILDIYFWEFSDVGWPNRGVCARYGDEPSQYYSWSWESFAEWALRFNFSREILES